MVNGYIAQHVIALQTSHRIHVNSPYCTWRKLRPLPNYTNDDSSCLGCDAVSIGKWFPAFKRNMSPSSSGVDDPLRNAINLAFFVDTTLGWRQLHLKRWEKKLTEQFYPWLKSAPSFQTLGTAYPAILPLVEDSIFLSNVGNHLPSNSTLGLRQHLPFKRSEPLTQHLYPWLKTATSFPMHGNTYQAMRRLTPQDRDPQQHRYWRLKTRYGFVVIRDKSLKLDTEHSCRMEFGVFADVFEHGRWRLR
jgi:hypothetical protein